MAHNTRQIRAMTYNPTRQRGRGPTLALADAAGYKYETFRLARHLWRMSTALLIAAFSFFIGQAHVIPKPIRIIPLLLIPPLVVLVTMLYWLWRVQFKKSLRGIARAQGLHSRSASL